MKILNFDKHLSLVDEHKIITICKPLFDRFKIQYFSYFKYYNDGTISILTTNNKFIKWMHKGNHSILEAYKYINPGVYLMKDLPCFLPADYIEVFNDHVSESLINFNIDFIKNGVEFVYKDSISIELYQFSSFSDIECLTHFYINNIDILNHFINYFNNKAKNLISLVNKKRAKLILKTPYKIYSSNNFEEELDCIKEDFYKSTVLDKVPIGNNYDNISLSKREVECLIYLASGCSAKEAAKFLKVSPRTAEYFIENSKQKLKCQKKSDLIRKFFRIKALIPRILHYFKLNNWLILTIDIQPENYITLMFIF